MGGWQISDSFILHVKDVSGADRLAEKPGDLDVVDASRKFSLVHADGAVDQFLVVSNLDFCDVVGEAAGNARSICQKLPSNAARRIVQPTTAGTFEEFSFAIYPRYLPLSDSRLRGRLQNLFFIGELAAWHAEFVAATESPMAATLCEQTVDRLCALNRCFDDDTVRKAKIDESVKRLQSGDHQPLYTSAAHNDLWRGNVLRVGGLSNEVRIIDWGGLNMKSNPFYDLIRVVESFRVPRRMALGLFREHEALMHCDRRDVRLYFYMAMADQLHSLDNFPMDRFRETVVRCDDILERYRHT